MDAHDNTHPQIVFAGQLNIGSTTLSKPVAISPHSMDCTCDQCIEERAETWRLKGLFFSAMADAFLNSEVAQ